MKRYQWSVTSLHNSTDRHVNLERKKYFVCPYSAFCMSIPCILYVHTVHFVCPYRAFCMSIPCILYVHTVHFVCPYRAFCMSIQCILYVHTVHFVCPYRAFLLSNSYYCTNQFTYIIQTFITNAPTCFGAYEPSSGGLWFLIAKVIKY